MSRNEVYLRHILDAIQKIERYAEAGRDGFMTEFPGNQRLACAGCVIHNHMGVDLDRIWNVQ